MNFAAALVLSAKFITMAGTRVVGDHVIKVISLGKAHKSDPIVRSDSITFYEQVYNHFQWLLRAFLTSITSIGYGCLQTRRDIE